jgi:hypothetical protein
MEIRPLSARLRKILHPEGPSSDEDGALMVGPHILKPSKHPLSKMNGDHQHNCSCNFI